MASSVENLNAMKTQLEGIYKYLPHFGHFADRPPILDILESPSARHVFEDEDVHTASGTSSPRSSEILSSNAQGDLLRHPHASVPGLRIFRESVKHDIEQIDKFLVRNAAKGVSLSTSTFSTNAPYLIAVWNELIRARAPVTFVDKVFNAPPTRLGAKSGAQTMPKTFSKKNSGVKVDVVSENGRRWVRVNTIKNSRLLAELRELDSYLTESESENDNYDSAGCACSKICSARRAPEELDNSLLQQGTALMSAAQSPSASGSIAEGIVPKVTLRLTRLLLDSSSLPELQELGLKVVGPPHYSITSKDSETDPRIAQTIRQLLTMGLEVELGEHDFMIPMELISPTPQVPVRLVPSHQINLDLSVLIALVSDLTHAPLPTTLDEAFTRFIPTPAERARSRRRRQKQKELLALVKARREGESKAPESAKKENGCIRGNDNVADGAEHSSDGDGESVHSQALANQVLREMDSGLLEEIAGRLRPSDAECADAATPPPTEFWTSGKVRDRFLRIIEKIGGPAEKRRASALFFRETASPYSMFGMTYESAGEASDAYWRDSRHPRNFIPGLAPLRIFDEDDEPGGSRTSDADLDLNPFWGELERACRRLLSEGAVSHPRALAVSTLSPTPAESHGAACNREADMQDADDGGADEIERAAVTRGNARLTAHTVDTLCRSAARRWTTLTANRASVREMLRESSKEAVRERDAGRVAKISQPDGLTEVAAIWVVEPRSLAEGMRGDFVPAP